MTPEQDCCKCRKDITYNPYIYYDEYSGEMFVCKECYDILVKG